MRTFARRWSLGLLCVLFLVPLLRPLGVHAQEADPRLETRLLRTAAVDESSGDLPGAEQTLRRLMGERPTSTRGIAALERVLRAQGRVHEVLPFAERFADLDPNASVPRLLEFRVYTELDDEKGLEDAAEDWMDGAGPFPEPYREVARAYGRVFGPERALSILERGRSELGRSSLFAMEAGDSLRDLGRMEEAVLEWAAVIGNDGSQVSGVMRRVREIEEDRETLVLPLLEQLRQPPTSGARLRAWAQIALEAGAFGEAKTLAEQRGWSIARDGEHWRRVVASPEPQRIFEMRPIHWLLENGATVICAGGGGIPTVYKPDGTLEGVEVVIDKDRASALLAFELDAGLLILATDTDGVYLDWGSEDARRIERATPNQMEQHEFEEGSMGPKVEAACDFVRRSGGRAVIGALSDMQGMVAGTAGTQFILE